MFVNFEDVFNQEKNDKQFKELHERALNEHWCCTCKHCQFEKDGGWCNFLNIVAENPCLFYEAETGLN